MGPQSPARKSALIADAVADRQPLTPAELRLLSYLPSQRTLTSIAGELFVAHSTAKTHSLAVYRKLGVNNRAEAIERAIELGLLPPASRRAAARRGA